MRIAIVGRMPVQVFAAPGGEGAAGLDDDVFGEEKLTTFAPGELADFGFAELADRAEALCARRAAFAPGEFPLVAVADRAFSESCHSASSILSICARKYITRPMILRVVRP